MVGLLRAELTLVPERTARMARMTLLVMLVVLISMALRVPEAAISAYMIFFVARDDGPAPSGADRPHRGRRLRGPGGAGGALVDRGRAGSLTGRHGCPQPGRDVCPASVSQAGSAGLRGRRRGLDDLPGLRRPLPHARGDGAGAVLWIWVAIAATRLRCWCCARAPSAKTPRCFLPEGIALRLTAVGALALLGGTPEDGERARRRVDRLERLGAGMLVPFAERGPAALGPLRASLVRETQSLLMAARQLPPLVASSTSSGPLRRAGATCLGLARELLDGKPGGAELPSPPAPDERVSHGGLRAKRMPRWWAPDSRSSARSGRLRWGWPSCGRPRESPGSARPRTAAVDGGVGVTTSRGVAHTLHAR